MATKKDAKKGKPAMAGEVHNGDLIRDMIGGARGVVVCVSDWLYGCRRITFQVESDKAMEALTIDEEQCAIVVAGKVKSTAMSRLKHDRPSAGGRAGPEQHAGPAR